MLQRLTIFSNSVAIPFVVVCLTLHIINANAQELVPPRAADCIRVATYNVSLNRRSEGQLERDLAGDDRQARAVAAVIRAVKPDILLLNEVDYSANSDNAGNLAKRYLESKSVDMLGSAAWSMPFRFSGPVNTGVPSGLDLNHNDNKTDPDDAWGYGRFPGQYGMALLSRFPIDEGSTHTLQEFLWSSLPDALRPMTAEGTFYYDDETWSQLRLSSKSFWDVPIRTPQGSLHVIASHPTPPAFDGPEDRNGCRNHDEIKLIQHYLEGAAFVKDDQGRPAGLSSGDKFVIVGDLNSDPHDGDSRAQAIVDLLAHPRVSQFEAPSSSGALSAATAQGKANEKHRGNPAQDTGDFSDRVVGNLRVDYVLPSTEFEVVGKGVFWPDLTDIPPSLREPVKQCLAASDHHLVWVDVRTK